MQNLDLATLFFMNDFLGKSRIGDFIIFFSAHYLAHVLLVGFFFYILLSGASKGEKLAIGLSSLFAGIIARYGITELIRIFWERPRPYLTYDITSIINPESYSFPSGHSTFFFAFSTVLYLYDKRIGSIAYVLTIIMTTARIVAGVHYPSDILGGALIGAICGYLSYTYLYLRLRKVLSRPIIKGTQLGDM